MNISLEDTSMVIARELEIQGYETYVYPVISLIDNKCKELNLKDDTIERAKKMAIKYIKDTYCKPRYTSIKYLLPAFVYLASIINDDKRTQREIADIFMTTESTIRKWYPDIANTLGIKIIANRIDMIVVKVPEGI